MSINFQSGNHLKEGYWSILTTLAWIASEGEASFTALVQKAESESPDADTLCGLWYIYGNEAGERFGCTFTMACEKFREALESGHVDGGIASPKFETARVVRRHEWSDWRGHFGHEGFEATPGLYNPKWPSEIVRAAFSDDSPTIEGVLPPSATRKHRNCYEHANFVAKHIRETGDKRSDAIRKAVSTLGEPRNNVQPESNERAIRETFDLMFTVNGLPHQN